MTPRGWIAAHDRWLAREGEYIVLQRLAADAEGDLVVVNEARLRAFVRAHQPQALSESDAPNSKAILSPTDLAREAWPGLPARDDRVVFQGGRKGDIVLVSPTYSGRAGVLVRIDIEWRE
jgi:hypothetical protein